ncbi:MAG: tRNA (adenosine(37)-N6)-threonylcarbamoyltransferase complex dimerization subunit type 1 TsaB [Candidatus Omnitrophota bacterium]|nr:tRNA (adenosine(37)-N6)-threonylcarbamoyltransferase complex dimerization subunit type 1 TsaB [Candidatus Omnitrophota bacterium]
MIILAIDTSTDYLSLAVLKADKVIAKFHKKADMRHSILLVPTIDKLLKKAKIRIKEIDCFAISVGPGSFTGLRIGVTVVKGLAFALNKPVIAVPTLDVIAMNARKFKGIICPVLDARKNKVYACLYRSDGSIIKRLSKYLLLPLDDLLRKLEKYDKVLFLGDAISPPGGENHFPSGRGGKVLKDYHPKAEIVARLAAEDFKKKKFIKAQDLEPMYIYSKECDVTGR